MLGIAFYGYMLGMFQNMFSNDVTKDQSAQQQESLNHWIIALNKVRKNVQLPNQVLDGVKQFYKEKFILDKMILNESEIFQ